MSRYASDIIVRSNANRKDGSSGRSRAKHGCSCVRDQVRRRDSMRHFRRRQSLSDEARNDLYKSAHIAAAADQYPAIDGCSCGLGPCGVGMRETWRCVGYSPLKIVVFA